MSKPYLPNPDSEFYHRISAADRAKIAAKTDKIFRERTGIDRPLSRNSGADRELRRTWLRIRDSVLLDWEVEKQMDEKRQDFIEDLPGIVASDMHAHGARTAARLMETWMSRPVAEIPHYSAPVTDIVKMDWVLGFQSAKLVYDRIFRDRIWTNTASLGRIAHLLRKSPIAAGGNFTDLSKPVATVDQRWINARSCNTSSDQFAITAALGRFAFHVAISGRVRDATWFGATLEISEVGVYVKDSYDFKGSQFLGFWGHRDSPANNSDFREWRTMKNLGGDFLVYSDVKRTKLTTPDVVTVTLVHALLH